MSPSGQTLLSVLRSRRGEIVSKSDLLDALYAGSTMPEEADNCLRVQISKLRKEVTIETVHGYRLPR